MTPKELEPIKIKIMKDEGVLEFSEGIMGISLESDDSIEKVSEDETDRITGSVQNSFEMNFDFSDTKKNIFRILIFGTNNWRKLHGLSMIRRKVWKEKLNLKH